MPELPDLEAFSSNLHKKLKGLVVEQIKVQNASKLNVSAKELGTALAGQTLEKVFREGKELWFRFSKGDVLALHLMLHGRLVLFESENTAKTLFWRYFSVGAKGWP